MPKVELPPGCRGLQFADGTHAVAAREGGHVMLSDEHAAAIDRVAGNGTAGLVTGQAGVYTSSGKKNGRWCKTCSPARLWQAWSKICPRCGAETLPES